MINTIRLDIYAHSTHFGYAGGFPPVSPQAKMSAFYIRYFLIYWHFVIYTTNVCDKEKSFSLLFQRFCNFGKIHTFSQHFLRSRTHTSQTLQQSNVKTRSD